MNQGRGVVAVDDLIRMLAGDGALVEQCARRTKKFVLRYVYLLVLRLGMVHASVVHATSSIYISVVVSLPRSAVRTSKLRQWKLHGFNKAWRWR